MKLIKLTRPDGLPVYVITETINHWSLDATDDLGFTKITFSGSFQRVKETPEDIVTMLGWVN